MGVRALNKYLLEHCPSIKKKHLSTFRGTIFAIDTSIYLYKFLGNFHNGDTRLEQGFHEMCKMFIKYDIKPIFVFDGKPPPEKRQVIMDRMADKLRAETEYNQLIQKRSMSTSTDVNSVIDMGLCLDSDLQKQLDALKRRFIRIKDEEIQSVKDIISGYQTEGHNIEYQEADGEADTLCAQLIRDGRAFGCLSNDMDMFAYGCPHIMRELDTDRSTVMYYNTKIMLRELDLSLTLFRQAIILSGTDYNVDNETPLYESIRLAREYQEYLVVKKQVPYNKNNTDKTLGFYVWLTKNTKYVKDYARLMRVYNVYNSACSR